MSRWSGFVVLGMFTGMLFAPAGILLEFHIHRAQIEKELCVQRDVFEGMRTCHGECQLSKRFKALEMAADESFPVDRIELRLEPQVPVDAAEVVCLLSELDRVFPQLHRRTLSGFRISKEHVPRG
jgi:hypothetical protein